MNRLAGLLIELGWLDENHQEEIGGEKTPPTKHRREVGGAIGE